MALAPLQSLTHLVIWWEYLQKLQILSHGGKNSVELSGGDKVYTGSES